MRTIYIQENRMATSEFNMSIDQDFEEDMELILTAKNDVEAFGRLYDKYYFAIFRYIYRCTMNRSKAEELVSNTFFVALKHINLYKWRGIPFCAWLYRIATNQIRSSNRKWASIISIETTDKSERALVDSLQSDDPAVNEELIRSEEETIIYQAILDLKPKYRTIIVLRFFEGKSILEICHITGRNEGTVKSQLHRALKQLRRMLIHRGINGFE